MFPSSFRGQRALAYLNVTGVGLAMGALAGLILGPIWSRGDQHPTAAVAVACATLLTGAGTAALLRWRRTVGEGQLRWGWLLSFFMAWFNALLVVGATHLLLGEGMSASEALFLLFSTTVFGAILWVPSWMAALVLFGAPIARAQQLASRGLAGEERGERVIGVAVATLSALALLGTWSREHSATAAALAAMGALGLGAGSLAAAIAWRRERRRSELVAEAEQGRAPGYRVEPSAGGKVLVRVATAEQDYRQADVDEEFFALDEQGQAQRPLRAVEPR